MWCFVCKRWDTGINPLLDKNHQPLLCDQNACNQRYKRLVALENIWLRETIHTLKIMFILVIIAFVILPPIRSYLSEKKQDPLLTNQ